MEGKRHWPRLGGAPSSQGLTCPRPTGGEKYPTTPTGTTILISLPPLAALQLSYALGTSAYLHIVAMLLVCPSRSPRPRLGLSIRLNALDSRFARHTTLSLRSARDSSKLLSASRAEHGPARGSWAWLVDIGPPLNELRVRGQLVPLPVNGYPRDRLCSL